MCLRLWCIQVQTDISVDTKQQTLQGVAFPLHKDAVAALERYRDKKLNYVQLVSPQELIISESVTFAWSVVWGRQSSPLPFKIHWLERYRCFMVRSCLQTDTMSYSFCPKKPLFFSLKFNGPMSQDQISTKYKGIIVELSLLCLSSLFVGCPKIFFFLFFFFLQ